jgi:hypothetical protein
MSKSLLALRIAAAAITSVGAGVALFGDTHSVAGLTRTGYLAIAAVMGGFVATAGIELLQVHADRRRGNEEILERQISEKWQLVERQQIKSLSVHFCHRLELPVNEFMQLMGKLSIALQIHSGRWKAHNQYHLGVSAGLRGQRCRACLWSSCNA